MSIISKPTGLSTEGNLLYEILKEIDYLTKVISNTSGGATFTFSNGLNDLTNNIKWGGVLIQNTDIAQGNNDLTFTCTIKTPSYTADYSSIYTDRSFADKGYVDSHYVFSNGITSTLGITKLGGTLSENTIILGATKDLVFGTSVNPLKSFSAQGGTQQSIGFNNTGLVLQDPNGINLQGYGSPIHLESATGGNIEIGNDTENLVIDVDNGTITIGDGTGLHYAADYSSGYDVRSLVDKDYVDNAISDKRLKENIQYIKYPVLDKILSLKPAEFDFIKSKEHKYGFIAQDVKESIPELVVDGDILKLKNQFIPFLVKAIQELTIEVNDLKSKLNA